MFRIPRHEEKKASEKELGTNSRRRNVHNNDDLDVSLTEEGLEYERLLRQAGKQFKGGKMDTEIEEGIRKIRINIHLAELERNIEWMCNIIKGRRNNIERQIFL
jgi:hypothetical protein